MDSIVPPAKRYLAAIKLEVESASLERHPWPRSLAADQKVLDLRGLLRCPIQRLLDAKISDPAKHDDKFSGFTPQELEGETPSIEHYRPQRTFVVEVDDLAFTGL